MRTQYLWGNFYWRTNEKWEIKVTLWCCGCMLCTSISEIWGLNFQKKIMVTVPPFHLDGFTVFFSSFRLSVNSIFFVIIFGEQYFFRSAFRGSIMSGHLGCFRCWDWDFRWLTVIDSWYQRSPSHQNNAVASKIWTTCYEFRHNLIFKQNSNIWEKVVPQEFCFKTPTCTPHPHVAAEIHRRVSNFRHTLKRLSSGWPLNG